jgi:hypothetical protein
MKKFLYSHPNIFIGTLAVVFIGILIVFYSWAIGDVFNEISQALATPSAQSISDFNLSGASKLDLRGLINSTSSASATTTVASPASSSTP